MTKGYALYAMRWFLFRVIGVREGLRPVSKSDGGTVTLLTRRVELVWAINEADFAFFG